MTDTAKTIKEVIEDRNEPYPRSAKLVQLRENLYIVHYHTILDNEAFSYKTLKGAEAKFQDLTRFFEI